MRQTKELPKKEKIYKQSPNSTPSAKKKSKNSKKICRFSSKNFEFLTKKDKKISIEHSSSETKTINKKYYKKLNKMSAKKFN